MTQCFSNMFHSSKPRCTKAGRWWCPGLENAAGKFVWCNDHKFDDDIRYKEEPA